jgi:hypothetical protein
MSFVGEFQGTPAVIDEGKGDIPTNITVPAAIPWRRSDPKWLIRPEQRGHAKDREDGGGAVG